jgi:hypothetical protein
MISLKSHSVCINGVINMFIYYPAQDLVNVKIHCINNGAADRQNINRSKDSPCNGLQLILTLVFVY